MNQKFRLLSRDDFREGVFKRDSYKCVICKEKGIDAHHIIERRLFTDGGYYLENGSTLCTKHHLLAESTELSCQEIRDAIGITDFPIPEHMYRDIDYDKWGNILLSNGTRIRGELFNDESVQKIIKPVLDLFSKYVKYPRTYHVPWSVLGKDDRQLEDDSNFKDKEVVVTLKMDGENSTLYNDFVHARSLNSGSHPTRDWLKGYWSQICYLIDENMRLCGENMYAVHSIKYNDLKSYFYLFSIWVDMKCLSWDETKDFATIIGCEVVPEIYRGIYDKKAIEKAFAEYPEHEGYVIRITDEFTYGQFRNCVAKYVRPEFRQMINSSHGHWISKKIEKNELSSTYNKQ